MTINISKTLVICQLELARALVRYNKVYEKKATFTKNPELLEELVIQKYGYTAYFMTAGRIFAVPTYRPNVEGTFYTVFSVDGDHEVLLRVGVVPYLSDGEDSPRIYASLLELLEHGAVGDKCLDKVNSPTYYRQRERIFHVTNAENGFAQISKVLMHNALTLKLLGKDSDNIIDVGDVMSNPLEFGKTQYVPDLVMRKRVEPFVFPLRDPSLKLRSEDSIVRKLVVKQPALP